MSENPVRESTQQASVEPKIFIAIKIALVVWMLSYTTAALVLIVEGWLRDYGLLRQGFGATSDHELPNNVLAAYHTVLGGVLGAGTLGMVSFHKHVSVKREFDTAHVWGYIFAPWLAGILGLLVFALLQAGLLVFSGPSPAAQSDHAPLGYLAIGFLSGFGWDQAIERIRIVVKQFFSGKSQPSQVSSRPPSDAERMRVSNGAPTDSKVVEATQETAPNQLAVAPQDEGERPPTHGS